MKEKLEIIINIIHQLDVINSQLAEKASALEAENNILKEENSRLYDDISVMKTSVDEYEKKYISYVEDIKKCNDVLQINYTTLNENYASLLSKYKNLNDKLNNFINVRDNHENEKKHLLNTIDELKVQLTNMTKENEHLKNKCENTPEYTEEIFSSPRHEKTPKRNAPQDINC